MLKKCMNCKKPSQVGRKLKKVLAKNGAAWVKAQSMECDKI